MKAIQDWYPEPFAHCFGCGPANPHGLHLKSYLAGDRTQARFTPPSHFSGGVPGNVYGGMIASLLDCHGTASAAAFAHKMRGNPFDEVHPLARFVTGSLRIDFRKPTPLGEELLIEGALVTLEGRKATVALTLSACGEACAVAEMIAIEIKR